MSSSGERLFGVNNHKSLVMAVVYVFSGNCFTVNIICKYFYPFFVASPPPLLPFNLSFWSLHFLGAERGHEMEKNRVQVVGHATRGCLLVLLVVP